MAAETAYTEKGAEAAASGGLPQFDFSTWASQIFWLVVTFGILYFVLSKFILPAIATGISEREDRIADDLDSASRLQREAEEAEKVYEQSLADARAKAHNVAETTRRSVEAEIATETEAAEARFARDAETAEARIREVKAKAMSNVEAIATDVTEDILTALIGKSPEKAKLSAAVKGG